MLHIVAKSEKVRYQSPVTKETLFPPFRASFASMVGFPGRENNPEFAKLFWLVKLRWLAVVTFFLLSAPGLYFGFLTRQTAPVYLGIVAVLFLFNLITQSFCSEKDQIFTPRLIFFQLSFDLFALSGLLYLTGGFSNPFVALFLLNASLGGLLIPGLLSWPFLVLMHSLLALLQAQFLLASTDQGPNTFLDMLIFQGLIFAFWLVMRSLGVYLERQHERQLQARVSLEKQDRLRAVGALAAGFSHEFASPLNAAKIRLGRFTRSQSPEDIREAILAIQACEEVVKQMNSSQLDTRDFHKKNVKLKDLLQDVADSWAEDHPGIALKVDAEDIGQTLIAPVNFAQVVLNLLDNAVEANPPIQLRLFRTQNQITFQVEDEGPGFPKSILAKVGEPFNTNKPEGTGLGLYVSQIFAESMGGSLRIQNKIVGGATVGASVRLEWPGSGT